MKQLTQKLKNGQMQVTDVPFPVIQPGMVLVRNYYSLISAGTESRTVSTARKGLVGKAKKHPRQVKQVVDVLKQQGPVQTYRTVMTKLESYSPLGYSSAGQVINVARDVEGFSAGDFVACGGSQYAYHAEIVAVPRNLCVNLSRIRHDIWDGQDKKEILKKAAYNTLGAIALQGIRQADPKIGETCAVIGLGLIGQLTAIMLKAGGVKVVGIDIDVAMVDIASRHCSDLALRRVEQDITDRIAEFTEGIGVDAVIITAATSGNDPIDLAGSIARKKGRVVIVGDVPAGFERENYYRKELELKMSCSYGPGRYDPNYEEKGIDYPVGYVRWTENRNMKAFQELVHSGKITIDYLTTHVFKLDDAPKAYDMILKKKESYLGILLEYDTRREKEDKKIIITHPSPLTRHPSPVRLAFIGAGKYAQGYLLPNIQKNRDIVLKGVLTSSGTTSRMVSEKYGFEFCTSDEKAIFDDREINTVFIATRHNTHAEYVLKALRAGKHVFVEKPLCLTLQQLEEIREVYGHQTRSSESDDRHPAPPLLMVGFNRRFAPLSGILRENIGSGPMSMLYRINAGHIPSESWIQDKDVGGGRIIGEVCHFIDYLTFLNGSLPESVYAASLPDPDNNQDTVNITLTFSNGSIGTVSYFSTGPKSLSKEYVEVYKDGIAGILRDFRELEIYGRDRPFRKRFQGQDKGQKAMTKTFIDSIKEGTPSPISFEDIYSVALTTIRIKESISQSQAMKIE